MVVNAVEMHCEAERPSIVEIEIEVQNQAGSPLTAIDMSIQAPGVAKIVGATSYTTPIGPAERATFRLGMEMANVVIPQKVKVLFVPTDSGAESLEAILRVYPSFFLMPGEASLFDEAQTRAVNVERVKPATSAKPKDVLQCVVNVLRGTIMKTSEVQLRTLYSRSTMKDDVICNLQIEATSVFIELKASNLALAKSLIREIDWKLKSFEA
jgi:hypothetical protein